MTIQNQKSPSLLFPMPGVPTTLRCVTAPSVIAGTLASGQVAQRLEHHPDKVGVEGSNPSLPTNANFRGGHSRWSCPGLTASPVQGYCQGLRVSLPGGGHPSQDKLLDTRGVKAHNHRRQSSVLSGLMRTVASPMEVRHDRTDPLRSQCPRKN